MTIIFNESGVELLPLSIHVSVAASGVAELSPTPTPLRTAIVASVPVIEEQNACMPQILLAQTNYSTWWKQ